MYIILQQTNIFLCSVGQILTNSQEIDVFSARILGLGRMSRLIEEIPEHKRALIVVHDHDFITLKIS